MAKASFWLGSGSNSRQFFSQIQRALNSRFSSYFLASLVCFSLLFQFAVFSSQHFLHSEPRSLIRASDNDSDIGVEIAVKTEFLNDNGSRAYGPLYYRISVLVRWLGDALYDSANYSKSEFHEKTVYFILQFLNLLCVYLAGFVFANFLFEKNHEKLFSVLIFSSLVLSTPWRSQLVFMAKPDHLFALLVLLAVLMQFMWFLQKSTQAHFLKWSAILWGLAFCTKMTALLFLPSILLLFSWNFLWSDRKKLVEEVKTFAKYLVLSYFISGFPQNFDVLSNIEYLLRMNKLTHPVDLAFFNHWLELLRFDLGPLFQWLLLVVFFMPLRQQPKSASSEGFASSLTWQQALLLMAFSILALFILVSKKTDNPHEWYTFPFSFALVLSVVFLCRALFNLLARRNFGFQKFNTLRDSPAWFVMVLLGFVTFFDLNPKNYAQAHLESLKCKPEAKIILEMTSRLAAQKNRLLVDPYVPYNASLYHDKEIRMAWEMSFETIERDQPNYIFLCRNYYRDLYLSPEAEKKTWNRPVPLSEIQKFYRLFDGKQKTRDHRGIEWIKIHDDSCGNEVWQKGVN